VQTNELSQRPVPRQHLAQAVAMSAVTTSIGANGVSGGGGGGA